MRADWRGLLAIAATYVAFLLFAQFGFLSQVQKDLADANQVKAVMASMGIAGLAASLGTAWLLGRFPAVGLVRVGLGAVAGVAVISVACHGFAALFAVAAGIGGAIGVLTVALATGLPEMVPGRTGLAAGLGTGVAYFVSNLPVLFEAAPAVRALFPAGLALLAAVALTERSPTQRPSPPGPLSHPHSLPPGRGGRDRFGFVLMLVIFLVLVWLDSAAFAIVQANPELKAQTWGSVGQKLVQGSVHLVAAIGAGALLDAGFGLAVPLASCVLFAVAFPLLLHGAVAAGPLYAAGISLYSTALVVMPTWRRPAAPPPRWRAGLLYGIAGWLGSALGVGMVQDLDLRRVVATPTPGELLQGGEAAAVLRGRRVYIAEGCIHCHSQYVRPGTHDEVWWGPSRPLDRTEEPPLAGARRQGPDLLEVGNRRSAVWHEIHLRDPRALHPGSRMPSYAHLFSGDGQRGRDLIAYLMSLGDSTAVERWEITTRERMAPPPAPPSAARGATLFVTYCAVCHGEEARGDGLYAEQISDPYMNLRKPGFHSVPPGASEGQALARIIRYGLPPTTMPGHEWLTDQQIADLVAHVRTLPARQKGAR